MTQTPTDVRSLARLSHWEAMQLQLVEVDRAVAMLSSLSPDDWTARTDCPEWDVREVYLHVLGACEGSASPFQGMHQLRLGRRYKKRHGGELQAGMSAVQVAERQHLSPADLVEKLAHAGPRAVRRRGKLLGWFRRHMKVSDGGQNVERFTLGYLVDTIYLRDLWMHRVDASRATAREMVLTAEHDGRIVADIVAEWARRHGQPFTLELIGPAGGRFRGSAGAEPIVMDAVEFCRTVAGRAPGTGLLATTVPF